MIRVFKSGAHAHRSPLSYAALAPLFQDTITQTARPDQADMYVFSHILDIQNAPKDVVLDWRARRVPIVLLSEEPFWDTIWGKQPLEPLIYVETEFGPLPVVQLSHQTSDIFDFDYIPYYLLTNHRFANAYQSRFVRNAEIKVSNWKVDFATRPIDVSFMFERRPELLHSQEWPLGDLRGLCSWRTELAEMYPNGQSERLGHSWRGTVKRWDLPDWHVDKLVRLDRRPRLLSAIENTHQPQYVTEKIFDAFACGTFPFYVASSGHRIHDFGLPQHAWINLEGLCPKTAVEKLISFEMTPEILEAYQLAQQSLSNLFGDVGLWVAERARLGKHVLRALHRILDDH